MKLALTAFDELVPLPRLLQIRNQVLEQGFSTLKGPDGFEYPGSNATVFAELPDAISQAIDHPIAVHLQCFRHHPAGSKPHNWIHADNGLGEFAGVLYLNLPEQCQGGTAFWRHKGTGLDAMPSPDYLEKCQWKPGFFNEMMNREWKKKKAWEMLSLVGMKWGRFVAYPTTLFHSRWPFLSFGDTDATARLIWVCFFTILPKDYKVPGPLVDEKPADEPNKSAAP